MQVFTQQIIWFTVTDIKIFTMCQPLNAWDIEIEELLTFFDDFNIISSKQFHEKTINREVERRQVTFS